MAIGKLKVRKPATTTTYSPSVMYPTSDPEMQATTPGGKMRTDRHNNPTAFTTDVARNFGLVEGRDFVQGDPFGGGKYYTAKLLGDPINTTIRALDYASSTGIGAFTTSSGKKRWSYETPTDDQWLRMTPEQKRNVIAQMYKREGGSGELLSGGSKSSLLNNFTQKVEQSRQIGKTDTEILDYLAQRDPSLAPKIEASRRLKDDREIVNYLSQNYGGAIPKTPSVPTQEQSNESQDGLLKTFGKAMIESEVGLGKTFGAALTKFLKGKQIDEAQKQMMSDADKLAQLAMKTTDPEQKKRLLNGAENQYKMAGVVMKDVYGEDIYRTSGQRMGDVAGVMLDVATAGTYGKAKAGYKAGQLMTKSKLASGIAGQLGLKTTAPTILKEALGTMPKASQTMLQRASGIGKEALKNIPIGAGIGYGYDVSMNLQQGKEGADIFKPGFGTLMGGGIPAVIGGAKLASLPISGVYRVARSYAKPTQKMIATEQERVASAWSDVFKQRENTASKLDFQKSQGKDPEKVLSNYVPDTEYVNGKTIIKTKVDGGVVDQISEDIGIRGKQIQETLDKIEQINPLEKKSITELENEAIGYATKEFSGLELDSTINKIKSIGNSIRTKYGDNIGIGSMNRERVSSNSLTKAWLREQADLDAFAVWGNVFRNQIDNLSGSKIIRDVNKEIGELIAARKMAILMDGKNVGGGRFTNIIASAAGALLGGMTTPNQGIVVSLITSLASALGVKTFLRYVQSGKFGGAATKRILQALEKDQTLLNELLKQEPEMVGRAFLRMVNKKYGTELKMLPAPQKGAFRSEIKSGKVIGLPSKTTTAKEAEEVARLGTGGRTSAPMPMTKALSTIPGGNQGNIILPEKIPVGLRGTPQGQVKSASDARVGIISKITKKKPISQTSSWSELQKTNPDLFNNGILRKSLSPKDAEGVIPENIHSIQGKWQNYGEFDEISADKIYKRIDSGSFKGEYEDKLGFPVRDKDGGVLQDAYDEATGQYISQMVSNKELRNELLSEFSTPEGKRYLGEVIDALPKNSDGTITAYRIGKIGGGEVQSYTLSEGMAKTFSNQGTSILPAGTPGLPTKGYKDFGALPTNIVKIDPKGIKAWNPYDAEILVDPKFVKTKDQLLKESKKVGISPKNKSSSLIQEAKKYKSAEEFLKAQVTPVAQHKLLGDIKDIEGIKTNGFREGFNVNALPIYGGGNPSNVIDTRYGPKKGDTMILVPKNQLTTTPNGYKVKKGYKPTDAEIVKIEYDFQSPLEARKSKLTDIWNKANKKTVGLKPPKKLLGATLGIQPDIQKDEKGNITFKGIKFDPKMATIGMIGGVAITKLPTKKINPAKITTKILDELGDRATVSKQFIIDLTNKGDVKQVEKDLIRGLLEKESDKIDVPLFSQKVRDELLPLNIKRSGSSFLRNKTVDDYAFSPRYENISLPDELRGNVRDYREKIYESPIKTSAGEVHFRNQSKNYFGHTRIEDMANKDTRRVIEVQSDLYQKGNLEREFLDKDTQGMKKYTEDYPNSPATPSYKEKYTATQERLQKEKAKLLQYNDPTAHFRMVREEVKQAAIDGKTKLQFPTGETAMKIEGLGQTNEFSIMNDLAGSNLSETIGRATPENIKTGQRVNGAGGEWIITDVLGDGKFRAVTKRQYDAIQNSRIIKDTLPKGDKVWIVNNGVGGTESYYNEADAIKRLKEITSTDRISETFDISGKVDTSNPIYKFYEKDLGKYLKNKYNAKLITDDKGVSWYEIDVNPEWANKPVQAFGMTGGVAGFEQDEEGKWKYNVKKGLVGLVGGVAATKVGSKATNKSKIGIKPKI